jgi:hypothetical protein
MIFLLVSLICSGKLCGLSEVKALPVDRQEVKRYSTVFILYTIQRTINIQNKSESSHKKCMK